MIDTFYKFVFSKNYLRYILLSLIFGIFFSVLFFPSAVWIFTIASILLMLVTLVSSILEKHKGAENERKKIARDISVLILTLTLVILLGGLAGTLAGRQVQAQFGAGLGIFCALIVSFVVGYLVKKGLGKVLR
jgi:DMSO/TMAO reductase YedYZ heme-binding membrane subunit